ncbi:TetR/AcrR family transcriptional regulator [Spirochaetota bacterium]
MNIIESLDSLNDLEQSILKASYNEFEKKGYYRANVDDIALKLKIGKGTIYRHFGNKIELFASIILYLIHKAKGEFIKINKIKNIDTAVEYYIKNFMQMNKISSKFMKHMGSEECLFTIQNELHGKKKFHILFESMFRMRRELIDCFKNVLDRNQKKGVISRDINTGITSEIIFVLINNFLKVRSFHANIKGKLHLDNKYSTSESTDELKKFIYKGIGLKKKK